MLFVVPALNKKCRPEQCKRCKGDLTVITEGFRPALVCESRGDKVCVACAADIIGIATGQRDGPQPYIDPRDVPAAGPDVAPAKP